MFQSPQLSSRKQPKNTTAYENGITNACTGTGFTLRSKPARNAGVIQRESRLVTDKSLIEAKGGLVVASGAKDLLDNIRPEWKAKGLIARTSRLLPVDPSSACQRLLNAAINDLKEKLVIAGVDLASEAARQFKLPPINNAEDITESYTTARIIDLAYRVGLLSRAEWRKIKRCYEIRGDLEHEDEEYEADVDDILYIFKNCIELILAKEPLQLLKVADVSDLIDQPDTPVISGELLEEYDHAPEARQKDIVLHLINNALNTKKPDVVRQNSMEILRKFRGKTKNKVLIDVAAEINDRYNRRNFDLLVMKVAQASGVQPYLKQRKVKDYFETFSNELAGIGHSWTQHSSHRKPLEDLEDVGGLSHCPEGPRQKIVLWMVLAYLGEPGGYGDYGRHRAVFYSDVAAPRVRDMFASAGKRIEKDLEIAAKDKRVKAAVKHTPIARRFEGLQDLIED